MAATHVSYLDPFSTALAIIRRGRRPRFLAKAELFRIPLVGRALKGAGQIAVARGTGDRRPDTHRGGATGVRRFTGEWPS